MKFHLACLSSAHPPPLYQILDLLGVGQRQDGCHRSFITARLGDNTETASVISTACGRGPAVDDGLSVAHVLHFFLLFYASIPPLSKSLLALVWLKCLNSVSLQRRTTAHEHRTPRVRGGP